VIAAPVLERDAVITACAISAGIHAGLAPGHFAEGTGAGLGFAGATVLLAALAAALTWRPSPLALVGAVVVLAGLIGSYGLAVTSGVPLLHPTPEPIDGLAVFTKAVETAGLAAAAHLLWRRRPELAPHLLKLKGTSA
jgi:hypothetical protein